jgi:hypothetical protein
VIDVGPRSPDDEERVRARILRYFADHPNAADTADGVRRWWLADLPCTLPDVERALDGLVGEGQLTARTLPDGSTVYSRRS